LRQALVFSSEEALWAALTSGLVPESVSKAEAQYCRTGDGGLAVCPSVSIPRADRARLVDAGVTTARVDEAELEPALCWPALLAPRTGEVGDAVRAALLIADGATPLLEVAGELVRLGCERAGFQHLADGRAAVRAYDPPFYTLAADGAGYRVFAPSPPDQDRVWVELGHHHPLAHLVAPSADTAVLIAADGWTAIEVGEWRDIFELISLTVDEAPRIETAAVDLEPLRVPLRLVRDARAEAPSMWVLDEDAITGVEAAIAALPEAVIDRLSFAVTDGDPPSAILRARPSRHGPPAIECGGLELAPLAGLSNLLAPPDVRIEPPLGRDRLRELLAPDLDRVYWLTPGGDAGNPGRFATRSVPIDAFVPLPDWVEYVIDADAEELSVWVRSTRFELTEIEAAIDDEPKRGRYWSSYQRRRRRRMPAEVAIAAEPVAAYAAEIEIADPSETARLLAEAERRFLESEAPLDAGERAALWVEMARLHAAAGNLRAATGCFARAMWEPGADPAIAGAWARAMPAPALIDEPEPGQVAGVIATVVAGLAGDALAPGIVGPWLDRHDDELDVRSIWLARLGLASAVGGDRIGLARVRDRLLRRLAVGLSLARDVPSFLRFAGSDGDSAAAENLAARLEALLERFRTVPRSRSSREAPEAKTAALVELEIAFGLASLGDLDRARELRAHAAGGDPSDPIDRFLLTAYAARIDQALEGHVGQLLPAPIAAQLDELSTFDRYKVDRLRQASGVLEPSARLDPMTAFSRGTSEMYGEAIAAARRLELTERLAAIDELIAGDPDRQTLLGAIDLIGELPVAEIGGRLRAAVDRIAGTELAVLTRALEVAGLAGRNALCGELLESIEGGLGALDADAAAEVAGELVRSLRPMRRAGLVDGGLAMFAALAARVGDWRGRGHVAAGLAFLGDTARAAEIRAADLAELDSAALQPAERLGRIRALATACAAAPRDQAIAELEQLQRQLPRITDSYNTNSHFCLSVVSFIDAMVLGLASRDLMIGELGRRFRDTDEHLVRRRIHRDMETM
jgi:hypothetical protein